MLEMPGVPKFVLLPICYVDSRPLATATVITPTYMPVSPLSNEYHHACCL